MMLDTQKIIHACERMWTASKRVQFFDACDRALAEVA